MTNLQDDRSVQDNLWIVFDYEVGMYFETLNARIWIKEQTKGGFSRVMWTIRNSVTESMVLHTRILIDILISKKKQKSDDIGIDDLLPDWYKTEHAKKLIGNLEKAYGSQSQMNSPCWVFNKMPAHPTKQRGDSFDYGVILNQVSNEIHELLIEILKITNRPLLRNYLT